VHNFSYTTYRRIIVDVLDFDPELRGGGAADGQPVVCDLYCELVLLRPLVVQPVAQVHLGCTGVHVEQRVVAV